MSGIKNRPEEQLHQAVVEYLLYKYPRGRSDLLWWHTRNETGGNRSVFAMSAAKKSGMWKGMADFTFILPDRTVAFIELKAGKTRQSPAQKEFQQIVEARRIEYNLCRSIDEVIRSIDRWMLVALNQEK